jgi:hypothetical protein
LLLLPLTALAQTVTTDNDPKAPFATYKAYAWAQGTAAQNPLNETRIHDGVDARMVAAGFKLVNDNADVNVASHAVAQEKKELNAMGMGGGLRFGGYALNILSSALPIISAFFSGLSLIVSVAAPRHTSCFVLPS